MDTLIKPRKKYGGRTKGTPNKLTSEIRQLAKTTLEEDHHPSTVLMVIFQTTLVIKVLAEMGHYLIL